MSKYSSYILYLLLSILVAILYVNDFGPMAHLQRSVNDTLCRLTAPTQAPSNVALVTIDPLAQKAYGPWPWNRDRIADLLAATAGAEPKAIFLDIELPENASQDSMGYTDTLAVQMSWVRNLVLPYDITLANFRSTKTSNPKYLFKSSVSIDNPVGVMGETSSLNVRKVFLPAEKLLANNPYLGFDYSNPDEDRVLRYQPVCMNYEGYYYPAAPVIAAAAYLGIRTDQIRIVENKEIILGSQRQVPINDRGEYFVNFTKGNSFATYSAAKVLGASFDFSQLKDRLVLIGVDDPQNADVFTTPVAANTPDLAVKATVAENIINNNFLAVKDRSPLADMLILFGLGAACAFLLPRLALKYRLLVPAGLLVVLIIFDYVAASSFRTLHQSVYIGLQLMLFIAASPLLDLQMLSAGAPAETKKATRKKVPKVKVEKTQAASSGADYVPVREIKATAVDPENQKTVAMDYEEESKKFHRSHQEADGNVESTRATSSDGAETQHSETTEHSSQPLEHNALLDENITGSSDSDKWQDSSDSSVRPSSQELTLTPEQCDLKSLGRYQITGVLGKGAMGMVYKGIDPAINRPVALKTIRLDFVNDPAEFEELRERLYREAQAAGKLSHPNIVTIYDVGSEGPLQYIAMEYLEGQTLENLIKKKTKFNYRIIAQIITQICNALDYAHERGIVHRDIKPANVMVLSDYRIKVMDFGIARIDSNSMTKTGIAMGTPNYISPEQLRGLAIDRRADLFSLGVVMYEMLLGRRPFKGENITSLIYSILHHEPDKPSNVNPQIPLLFDHIIGKALRKVPQERYQKATDIISDLHDFVESFVNRQ